MIINETNYFNPEYSGSCFVVHDDGTLEITTHHSNCKQFTSKGEVEYMKKTSYPRIRSIVRMLAKKYAKGTYDHAKAAQAYLPVVVDMAKIYHKRFGSLDAPYYQIFTPQARYSAACMVADSFLENVEKNDL